MQAERRASWPSLLKAPVLTAGNCGFLCQADTGPSVDHAAWPWIQAIIIIGTLQILSPLFKVPCSLPIPTLLTFLFFIKISQRSILEADSACIELKIKIPPSYGISVRKGTQVHILPDDLLRLLLLEYQIISFFCTLLLLMPQGCDLSAPWVIQHSLRRAENSKSKDLLRKGEGAGGEKS